MAITTLIRYNSTYNVLLPKIKLHAIQKKRSGMRKWDLSRRNDLMNEQEEKKTHIEKQL